MSTSPLEREILAHYHTTLGPYRGGSENWSKLIGLIIRGFVFKGLLVQKYGSDTGLHSIGANEDALRVYMEALADVPLPVQRWVVPS